MVALRVGGKVVSWAEAERLLAEAAPTQAVEFRNAAGCVIAVSAPADEPDWVKAVTPESPPGKAWRCTVNAPSPLKCTVFPNKSASQSNHANRGWHGDVEHPVTDLSLP